MGSQHHTRTTTVQLFLIRVCTRRAFFDSKDAAASTKPRRLQLSLKQRQTPRPSGSSTRSRPPSLQERRRYCSTHGRTFLHATKSSHNESVDHLLARRHAYERPLKFAELGRRKEGYVKHCGDNVTSVRARTQACALHKRLTVKGHARASVGASSRIDSAHIRLAQHAFYETAASRSHARVRQHETSECIDFFLRRASDAARTRTDPRPWTIVHSIARLRFV